MGAEGIAIADEEFRDDRRLFAVLSRHFVHLEYHAFAPAGREAEFKLTPAGCRSGVSCFVISVRGEWFLITAGHCLMDIEKLKEHGISFRWRLDDSHVAPEKTRQVLPFDFDGAIKFCESIDGDDYGLIHLRDFYRRSLRDKGVVPLDEQVWRTRRRNFDYFVLMGVPDETILVGNRRCDTWKLITMLGVDPIHPSEAPESMRCLAFPRMFARIQGDIEAAIQLKSIKGMSGGPIFAFRRVDGRIRYWVVALQSTWASQERIIAACPLRIFGNVITDALKLAEKAGSET